MTVEIRASSAVDPVVAGGQDVTVLRREQAAENVVALTLGPPGGGELPPWQPGAHIDVAVGDGSARQYSLCGDPADRGTYRIAVLREPAGRGGSEWLHERVSPGDCLRIAGPRNHFALEPAAEILLIAGGIGVTPLLAMTRALAAGHARWRIVYGGRSRSSMAFRDELAALAGDRLRLYPQDEMGLIDVPGELAASPGAIVYCCGPEPLLAAVERACGERDRVLRVERFVPREQPDAGENTVFEVELASSGEIIKVPAEVSVVDALHAAGVDVPTSCREGTCGTCETAVLGGEPEHRDSLLTPEEQAAGDVMFPCVSRSRSARLVLDL